MPSRATRWPARPERLSRSTQPGGCYYSDVYWITFAGLATADNPRYVIGIMSDARIARGRRFTRFVGGAVVPQHRGGRLMQRENVPLSPDPGPPLVLQAT